MSEAPAAGLATAGQATARPATAGQGAAGRYGAGARALHWLTVLALAGAFGLAWKMTHLGFSPLRLKMFNWHKWVGIGVLLLTLLRLAWRWRHRPPPPLPAPAWQQRTAQATHGMLYVLLVVQPMLGWAYSGAAGVPVVWLGVLRLPSLLQRDRALAEQLQHAHELAGLLLLVLLGLHALAALKHHFIDHDATLRRMLPGHGETSNETHGEEPHGS